MCKGEFKLPIGKSTFVYCETARHLLDIFGRSVQAVLHLHEQQYTAIVKGDSEAGRFDLLIHEALEDKQNAKYAYLNHLDFHGCSTVEK